MAFPRGSGILLHPTSLPGRYGIGSLGAEAFQFVDFLVAAGQRYWQVLPLGHTGHGDSPYAAVSAFAGNPLLISLPELVEEGWLSAETLSNAPSFPTERVDYEALIPWKATVLKEAYQGFKASASEDHRRDMTEFCALAAHWLEDYALFMALKDAHDDAPWAKWESSARQRAPQAIAHYRKVLAESIGYYRFVQYVFFRQFTALKRYANEQGLMLIGDMPIFVAYDSADAWANRDFFLFDRGGRPIVVAGVPPDYFSATGQLWGNPLYRWDVMRRTGYSWWIARMQMALVMYDIVRIDHFRGFDAYWAIPYGDKTAVRGRWMPAPGHQLFERLFQTLGSLPIIAEDLGVITPKVELLRDRFGFPGMKVLQFAFGGDETNAYLPKRHIRNSVVYTGTHDNDTTVGWFSQAKRKEKIHALRHTGTDGRRIALDMMRLAMSSVADLAIFPMQDALELGSDARMNTPGVPEGNWAWRMRENDASPELALGLQGFAREFRR
ncbi:4-alpha-glucanotransferase [compost metagenome]